MTTGQKIGLAAGVVVVYVVAVAVSNYYSVLQKSRAAVESLEADGFLESRRCRPNQVVLTEANWDGLGRRHQDTVMRSLALMCQAEGDGFEMRAFSADTGDLLAYITDSDVIHRGAAARLMSREDGWHDEAIRKR